MTHYAPVAAALVSMLFSLILLLSKAGKAIQDVPNERSLHDEPVPRVGGVGLIAGVLIGWLFLIKSMDWWIVLPMLLLFAISLVDDMRGLPVGARLAVHAVAALMLLYGAGLLAHHPAAALLLLPAVIWMTNLYNFMDGSDGLAGGMALFGFAIFGLASLMHGEDAQGMANFAVSAAALGFLFHNFPPAKVFMGDAGSIPLGFLAAALGMWGWMHLTWPAWFPLMVFSPFIVDATVTLAKRTVRGARITEAHRGHYYQRLVQMGWSHRKVAVVEYVLMFAAGVSAIWVERNGNAPWILFAAWACVYAAIMLAVDLRWRAFGKAVQ